MISCDNTSVLDVDCGNSATSQELKTIGIGCQVTGIELVESAALIAGQVLDTVYCGDIETIELQDSEECFDRILMGDVIEHLIDPWAVLTKLDRYLTDEGCIIASIPNIRNWTVLRNLVFLGEWKYTSMGILDQSHLRFFTRSSYS